jgi:hypothetical protein
MSSFLLLPPPIPPVATTAVELVVEAGTEVGALAIA